MAYTCICMYVAGDLMPQSERKRKFAVRLLLCTETMVARISSCKAGNKCWLIHRQASMSDWLWWPINYLAVRPLIKSLQRANVAYVQRLLVMGEFSFFGQGMQFKATLLRAPMNFELSFDHFWGVNLFLASHFHSTWLAIFKEFSLLAF